jgi:hypothetical protein
MPLVTVTTDEDSRGFQVEVQPHESGGWITAEPGFHGYGPGQPKKVYVDGEIFWTQRRFNNLVMLPD